MTNTIEISCNDKAMMLFALRVNGKHVNVVRTFVGCDKRGRMMYEYVTITRIAPIWNMSNGKAYRARSLDMLVKKISKETDQLVIAA